MKLKQKTQLSLNSSTSNWKACQSKCSNPEYTTEKQKLTSDLLTSIFKNDKSGNARVMQSAKKSNVVQNYTSCALDSCQPQLVQLIESLIPALFKDITDCNVNLKKDPHDEFYLTLKKTRIASLKFIQTALKPNKNKLDTSKLANVIYRLASREPYQL